MSELNIGTSVELMVGGQVKIIKELGRGGQGVVYQVDYQGCQYALKWYLKEPSDEFYKNLKYNIDEGAPTKAFLWPLLLTRKLYGSFGYVMKLRPQGYYELGDFLLAKVRFASISTMITVAINICTSFEKLHLKGFSYQDMNDGNFFINPLNGDVLICDNDNITATGENSGILGKARYMAPEIIAGSKPDTYSDRFSLAVILFFLFYCNHPLEGRKVMSCPCMTEELERKLYGSEALFIYDKDNHENLPVRGIHQNVIARWPLFSATLRQAFVEAFSQEQIKNPTSRMLESAWKEVMVSLRNELVNCSICGKETFSSTKTCMECGKPLKKTFSIHTQYGDIVLSPKKQIYLGTSEKPVALVRINRADPSIWALQNISENIWSVETPSGKISNVVPTEVMPITPGLKITFLQGKKGVII